MLTFAEESCRRRPDLNWDGGLPLAWTFRANARPYSDLAFPQTKSHYCSSTRCDGRIWDSSNTVVRHDPLCRGRQFARDLEAVVHRSRAFVAELSFSRDHGHAVLHSRQSF